MALLATFISVGCKDLGPAPAQGWRTGPVPSGGYTQLSLAVSGEQVTGTRNEFGIAGHPEGSTSVSGIWTGTSFALVITPVAGTEQPASFTGTIVGGTALQGTWVQAGITRTEVFYKE